MKAQHELARQLWETDDTAARLLAILICRPKAFERDELDVMLREARSPKVHGAWPGPPIGIQWSRVPAGR